MNGYADTAGTAEPVGLKDGLARLDDIFRRGCDARATWFWKVSVPQAASEPEDFVFAATGEDIAYSMVGSRQHRGVDAVAHLRPNIFAANEVAEAKALARSLWIAMCRRRDPPAAEAAGPRR